jgi:SRSO17 transposase
LGDLAAALPAESWHKLTWRQGSQGPQRGRFTACRVQPAHGHFQGKPELEPVWLLIEWPPQAEAPTKYWFSNLPEEVSLRRLVRLAKLRWRVEQNYQQLKEELGLDHYEGRGWQGWHHHVTLVCLAYAFLLLERQRHKKTPVLTLPEARRCLQTVLIRMFGVCPTCRRPTQGRGS